MSTVQSAVADFLHMFFPHVCAGCGSDVLSQPHQLCLHCISELPETHFFDQPGNPVERKFYGRLKVENAAAGYFFTKDSLIEALIYELKYKGNRRLGVYMGERLGQLFLAGCFNKVDIIVPLP